MTTSERSLPPLPKSSRVLYVDDNPHLRQAVSSLLARHRYVVETAHDGLDAWAKVSSESEGYDLIITDQEMPRLDGVSLVRQLREAGFRGRLIVFASSLPPTSAAAFKALAVDAIVEKGGPVVELIEAVAQVARFP